MQYVKAGALTVSRIGFGCYAMSGVYGAKDPAVWPPLIQAAYEHGVTLFDTADRYGPAEEILGRAVAPFRDRIVIATKAGVSAGGRPDASRAYLVGACEASLRRLGTDRIDLYQVHFDDPATPVAETVAALEELRGAGKIVEYGVGHLPVARVREYLRAGRPAGALFELSPAARASARELLPLLQQHGVAGIAFSPTGRGLLTGAAGPGHVFEPGDLRRLDPLWQRERLEAGLRIAARLAEAGARLGRTTAQVAIAWVLAQPGVAAVLTGPSKPAHLAENVGACGWALPPAELAGLDSFLSSEEVLVSEAGWASVAGIVRGPLASDVEEACRDLIYVIEMAVERGWVDEAQVTPLAFGVLAALKRKGQPQPDAPSLDEIRSRLAGMLSTRLDGQG